MAHDVFISHASQDKPRADAIVAFLEANGVRCWVAPRDILPGTDWGEAIVEAIEQSEIMILVFSGHSNTSPQIRREIERAVDAGIPMVPVRIEDVLPCRSLQYFIGPQHWLDALTPPLEQHLHRLTDTIKVLLSKRLEGFDATSKEPRLKPPAEGALETPRPAGADPTAAAKGETPGEITPSPLQEWAKRRFRFIACISVLVLAVGATVVWHFAFPFVRHKLEKASRLQMAFPLPDKPSIAVLPFLNLSSEPNQDFFCDGLTESLITALSKVPQLFVIAQDSTFKYKGKRVETKQVGEELGVQYVMEGSVQRAGNRVRVTAQLINALTGQHLWSERYDRSIKDIFDLQDEITMKILTELRVKLFTVGETGSIVTKGTNNLEAYLKVWESNWYRNQNNKEANAVSKQFLEEAIRLDPNYSSAHIELSYTLAREVWLGASESPQETLAKAMKEAQRAFELDNSSSEALTAMSNVFLLLRQYDKAIEVAEQAVRLNPNSVSAIYFLASSLNFSFRNEEALPLLKQAIRFSPLVPTYYYQLAVAYRETGRFEEGIEAVKKGRQLAPNSLFANVILASLYNYAARRDEARAAAAEVMRVDPNFSLTKYFQGIPWKEGPRREQILDSLRQAGLR